MSTVYVDTLFFTNFCMDFLALWLVGSLLHRDKNMLRLFLSAFLGAGYAVIELLYGGHPLLSAVISVFVSLLLCLVAYVKEGFFGFMKVFLAFWGISALLGGVITVFYTTLAGFFEGEALPLRKSDILLTLGALSGVLILLSGRFFARHRGGKNVRLSLAVGEKSVEISALTDSGNLLSDPITSRPVILLRRSAAAALLGAGYRFPDERQLGGNMGVPRMHPVFVETVAGKEMMWAFTPDFLFLGENGRRVPLSAVVAVDRRDTSFGGCDALLPAVLLP